MLSLDLTYLENDLDLNVVSNSFVVKTEIDLGYNILSLFDSRFHWYSQRIFLRASHGNN